MIVAVTIVTRQVISPTNKQIVPYPGHLSSAIFLIDTKLPLLEWEVFHG